MLAIDHRLAAGLDRGADRFGDRLQILLIADAERDLDMKIATTP
jgi:hypothetical protein